MTYRQSCPWTFALPRFHRMRSELIYVYKDYVHISETPDDPSTAFYSLSSTQASLGEPGEDLFEGACAAKAPHGSAVKGVQCPVFAWVNENKVQK